MMRVAVLALLGFILIVSASCASKQPEAQALVGQWRRVGDQAAGDMLRIRKTLNGVEGALTGLSELSSKFGYQIGDVKWRVVKRLDNRRYEIDNLDALILTETDGSETKTKRYSPFLLTIVSSNEISVMALDNQPARIGNAQTWRRIEEETAQP